MKLGFVLPAGARGAVWEFLTALACELTSLGTEVAWFEGQFPVADEVDAYVTSNGCHLRPSGAAAGRMRSGRQLERTIVFLIDRANEAPLPTSLGDAGVVMSLDRGVTALLRGKGLHALHFQAGYTSRSDAWQGNEAVARCTDVAFVGHYSERRGRLLAGYGQPLSTLRSRLLFSDLDPRFGSTTNEKLQQTRLEELRSCRAVLHLMDVDDGSFDWWNVLQAMSNGCVVVSDLAAGAEPLVAGEHYLHAAPEDIGNLARTAVGDPEQLRRTRSAAYEFIKTQLPMRRSAEQALEVLWRLRRSPGATLRFRAARRAVSELGDRGLAALVGGVARGLGTAKELALRDPEIAHLYRGASELDLQVGKLRAAMKQVALDQLALRRQIEQDQSLRIGAEVDSPLDVAETPAYEVASPRVSVLMPVYNYAQEVVEALASVASSAYREWELVVLDDSSTDGSMQVVASFLSERPNLPARLLRQPFNKGLGAARNTLGRLGRGEFAFFLDADNAIYPAALCRLLAALDAEPGALFAYGISERRVAGRSTGLLSYLPWDPKRLRDGNYIDAMALFRRQQLIDIGGFDEDIRMTGWEDYDLWCRCAERELHGILVPEIVARYRQSDHSMLSLTNLDYQVMWSLLVNRHSTVLGGAPMPWSIRTTPQSVLSQARQ